MSEAENQSSEPSDNRHQAEARNDAMTLDPPGSIAVVGAGPLGIEAALYGRFLGYDVTLIEAVAVAARLRDQSDQPLPMLPDRCLSPLAKSALDAQFLGEARALPTTIEQWITEGWEALIQTDLLRGRLQCPVQIARIELVEVDSDSDSVPVPEPNDPVPEPNDPVPEPNDPVPESDEQIPESNDQAALVDSTELDQIPPDFRLTGQDESGQPFSLDVESVILATDGHPQIICEFDESADYFFRLCDTHEPNAEAAIRAGWKQIVSVYASLAGRPNLDLYRPQRGNEQA